MTGPAHATQPNQRFPTRDGKQECDRWLDAARLLARFNVACNKDSPYFAPFFYAAIPIDAGSNAPDNIQAVDIGEISD
jgi:hypothetical protein